MTHDDALLRALRELDQPVDPAAGFANRLQRQMHVTADIQIAAPSSQPIAPMPLHVPHEHRHWSQLSTVAGLVAAALLIAVLGGIWSLPRDSGTPPAPTVAASSLVYDGTGADDPVMWGGSAANDGKYPGPAPSAASYDRLWSANIPPASFTTLFGNHLYYAIDAYQTSDPGQLVALDSETGTEVWRREVSPWFIFSVVPGGVVVALPGSGSAEGTSQTFRVALLSHQTGEVVWQSETVYQLAPAPGPIYPRIAGTTILFADANAAVIAIDSKTGAEVWRYVSPGSRNIDCALEYCTSGDMVAAGDTVYFPDRRAWVLTALSLANGGVRWTAELPPNNTAPSQTDPPRQFALFAVDQGVIVSTFDPPDEFISRVSLHSKDDGATAWERDVDPPFLTLMRIGTSVYMMTFGSPDSRTGPLFTEVDIASGKTVQTFEMSDPNVLADPLFLPSADVVVGGYRSYYDNRTWIEENIPFIGKFFGNDSIRPILTLFEPSTFEEIGKPPIQDCLIILPVAPDGNVLCQKGDEIAVYAPKPWGYSGMDVGSPA